MSGPVSSSRRTPKRLNGIALTRLPAGLFDSTGALDLQSSVRQLDVAGRIPTGSDDERRCSSVAPVLSLSKHDDFGSLRFR